MAKITSQTHGLYQSIPTLQLPQTKTLPCAKTTGPGYVIQPYSVMLNPKSQAGFHPTVNPVLPISLSQPVPISCLRNQPPLQIVTPMTTFSIGYNKLQPNEDKIWLLSPNHSPHKVKVMYLHTGFFLL